MRLTRTQVDDALLGILNPVTWMQGNPPASTTWIKPVSKHWQDWSNTSNQPAAYLKRIKENVTQVLRGQNKYILKYELWVYAQFETSNPLADPYDSVLNPIIDALDAAINPAIGSDLQDLGFPHGIAMARWNGDADIADGSVDGQVVVVIPIDVFVSA